MSDTSEVIRRFNDAFLRHDPGQLDELVGEECVMEAIQPARRERYEGRAACLAFWHALASDTPRSSRTRKSRWPRPRDHRWRYRYAPTPLTTCAGQPHAGAGRQDRRSARLQQDPRRRGGAVGC